MPVRAGSASPKCWQWWQLRMPHHLWLMFLAKWMDEWIDPLASCISILVVSFPHVIADRHCIDRQALIGGLLIRAHTVDRYITYSTSSTTSYMSILKSYTANIWLFFYSSNHLAVVCLNILLLWMCCLVVFLCFQCLASDLLAQTHK